MAESSKGFSLFRKKSVDERPTADEEPVFDESCFDFQLKGGPYQTQLIEASATYSKGPNEGLPLPLHCTWYRSTTQVDFTIIEGVNGAFYQPNLEDVGCRICVHAVPASDVEEYTGMPAFQEVGPLQLNPKVGEAVSTNLAADTTAFEATYQGQPASLVITRESMDVMTGETTVVSCPITDAYPTIQLDARSNIDLVATVADGSSHTISTATNVERDVVAMMLKIMTTGETSGAGLNINTYVKIEQLNKALTKMTADKEALATKFLNAEASVSELRARVGLLEAELADTAAQLTVATTQLTDQRALVDTARQETMFFKQEISVYKHQTTKLERKLAKYDRRKDEKAFLQEILDRISAESESENPSTAELSEILSTFINSRFLGGFSSETVSEISYADDQEPVQIDFTLDDSDRYDVCKAIIQAHETEVQRLLVHLAEERARVEQTESERNFYKRKSDSLATDNEKLLTRLGKNPADVDRLKQQREEFTKERMIHAREKQFLMVEAETYRTQMYVTQKRLEEEIRRRQELAGRPKKAPPIKQEQLHNLVNALTQTCTEKDIALEAQKEINKQLINRTAEMEGLLAQLENGQSMADLELPQLP